MKYIFEFRGIKAHHTMLGSETPLLIAKIIFEKEKSPVRFYPENNPENAITVTGEGFAVPLPCKVLPLPC